MSDKPVDDTSAVDLQKVIGDTTVEASTDLEKEQAKALHQYSSSKVGSQLSMHVKVYSPFRNYYDDQAFSISAENATGAFDILPKHHNFISLLNPCELVIRTTSYGDRRIRISGGIMHVKADNIVVFLDV